jgi:hypothetical protein
VLIITNHTDAARTLENEINGRLDALISSPDPNWGSITNTSIEGGRANPITGNKGGWSGTVFQPFYATACGMDEGRAGMFYGNLWKKVIIERPERWIGIRSDPTFPQRGISLRISRELRSQSTGKQ